LIITGYGRDSAVIIEHRTDWMTEESWFVPGKSKILLQNIQTDSGTHSAPYSMDDEGSFPRAEEVGVKIWPFRPIILHGRHKDNSTFTA